MIFDNLIRLEPITTQEQLQELNKAAAEDDHITLWPTHRFMKKGEVVGYTSIARMPVQHFWIHSKKNKAMDTLHIVNLGENMMRAAGFDKWATPVAHTSPMHDYMPKLGFKNLGYTGIFVKEDK